MVETPRLQEKRKRAIGERSAPEQISLSLRERVQGEGEKV
jgi:hypothetical protein